MGMDRTIKRLRKQARLSQKDVAEALGVGQSAVSHWERGSVMPTSSKIPELARILGTTAQALFDELREDEANEAGALQGPDATDNEAEDGHFASVPAAGGATGNAAGPSGNLAADSPYLRSLEMAVMRADSLDEASRYDHDVATVPLVTVGKVHAGEFSDEDLVGRTVEVPLSVLRDHPSAEALVVEGDCMNRVAGDGTIVVFDPDVEPTNGRIVIVETEDYEALIRRWNKGASSLMLTADSYDYFPDIVIEDDRPLRVVGTVVYIVTPQDLL